MDDKLQDMNLNTYQLTKYLYLCKDIKKIDVDATKLIGTDMSDTNNATGVLRIITLIIF